MTKNYLFVIIPEILPLSTQLLHGLLRALCCGHDLGAQHYIGLPQVSIHCIHNIHYSVATVSQCVIYIYCVFIYCSYDPRNPLYNSRNPADWLVYYFIILIAIFMNVI